MRFGRRLITSFLYTFTTVTYLALVVWMHLWTLEAGITLPGQQGESHHQVCTWIGTSGEAGLACFSLPLLSKPTHFASLQVAPAQATPTCPIVSSPARAPPVFSVV